MKRDEIAYLTGDCPHEKQSECDAWLDGFNAAGGVIEEEKPEVKCICKGFYKPIHCPVHKGK